MKPLSVEENLAKVQRGYKVKGNVISLFLETVCNEEKNKLND